MANTLITIYDNNLDPVADLKNAYNISYDKKLNKIWKTGFDLPTDDPHFSEVQGRRFAEIYDEDERIGMFRIERPKENHDDTSFKCKHVLSTLIDDFLVGVHSGIVGTNSAIDYILNEQNTVRWQKGTIDFSRNFHHRWEDQSLLYGLFSIPDRYDEDYQWTWDTSSYPWTINLIKPDTTSVIGDLHYSKNVETITKDEDYSEIITKLFAYGNGAGADQLTLADSSLTSNEYIVDSTAQSEYGTVTRVWEDQRYTDADNLYEAAQARLDRKSTPRRVYSIDAIDLYKATGHNKLELGKVYQIRDEERDIKVDVRIERLRKQNVTGQPQEIEVELANQQKAFPDFGNVAYADDLDEVKSGGQFAKVYSTQIDAGEILLSAIKGGSTPTMPSTPSIAGLYLGASHMGYHNGSSWITYMDLDGQFRLEGTNGYLHWDPSTETLDLKGSITLTNSIDASVISDVESGATDGATWGTNLINIPDRVSDNASTGLNLTSSYLGYYDGTTWQAFIAGADGSGQLAGGDIQWDGTGNVSVTGAIYLTNSIGSGDITDVDPYTTGQDEQSLSTLLDDTPSSAGLFMDGSHLGFYDGTEWTVFIGNSGDFVFKGDTNNQITWDGTTLSVRGSLNADDITAGTLNTDYLAPVKQDDITIDGSLSITGDIQGNYTAGSSGWIINGDGSVEFYNGTFRGTLEANSGTIGNWDIGTEAITTIGTSGYIEAGGSSNTAGLTGYSSGTGGADSVAFWVGGRHADRTSATVWIKRGGNFKFGNYSGGQGIYWDGSTLHVEGDLTVDSISADKISGGTLDFTAISRSGLEVIESELGTGSVTKDKIDVVELSAINVNMGTLTGGYISLAGGDVVLGEGAVGTSPGVLVKGGGKIQVQDASGRTIFDSNGDFLSVPKVSDISSQEVSGLVSANSTATVFSLASETVVVGGMIVSHLGDATVQDQCYIKISDSSGNEYLYQPTNINAGGNASRFAHAVESGKPMILYTLPYFQTDGSCTIEIYNEDNTDRNYYGFLQTV